MSNLRKKIINNELVFGTWMQTGNAVVAEIMAECGWDFMAADMEHTSIDENDFVDFARAIKGLTSPLARVESDDPLAIRKVLDLGAEGVIVPMINNREQAKKSWKQRSMLLWENAALRGFVPINTEWNLMNMQKQQMIIL